MVFHLLSKHTLLYLVPMFKQFLDNIIAKNVSHKLKSIRLDFAEELLLLIAIGCFKLLLNEPRAMLITTKFNYVMVDILNDC
jgi:hypothetical protein